MTIPESPRAILRRFNTSDLANLIQLESDPDIMRFTPSRIPQSKEQTAKRLQALIEKEAGFHPRGVWAAELKGSKDFIGWFGLLNTDYEFPELGFMVVKRHWGQGLATEIAGAVMDYGMNALNLGGIMAVTDQDNATSIHILSKLGFRFQKLINKFDKVLDEEVELRVYEYRRLQ